MNKRGAALLILVLRSFPRKNTSQLCTLAEKQNKKKSFFSSPFSLVADPIRSGAHFKRPKNLFSVFCFLLFLPLGFHWRDPEKRLIKHKKDVHDDSILSSIQRVKSPL
jgi:hypothetical protein